MRRRTGLLACLLILLLVAPVRAQTPAAQTRAAAAATTPQLSAAQVQQALEVLSDPAKRAAVTATLEAIVKAQAATSPSAPSTAQPGGDATPATPPAAPAKAPPPPPASPLGLPLAPDSLGAAVLVGAAAFLNSASDRVTEGLHAAQGLPLLWSWLVTMATDPIGHMLIEDLAWRLAVALAASFAAFYGTVWLLRRPLRLVVWRLARLHPPLLRPEPEESGEARAEVGESEPPWRRRIELGRLFRRVPLVLARLALMLVPVVLFLVVGHAVVGSALGGTELTRLVLLAVVDSIGLCMAALRLVRSLLAPRHRRLRLVPLPDHTAVYAMTWIRRLLLVGVIGYAAAEVGLLLGLSHAAHLAVLKAVVLVEHIFIAIIVVEKRRVVRRWIHAPDGATGLLARLRNRVAAIWHWIALFYLVSLWLVWAVALPAGYAHLTRVLVVIVIVALLARVATSAGLGALERLKGHAPQLADRYPGIDVRLGIYLPFLVSIVRLVVLVFAALLFLELMGLGAFQWLAANPLGERIIESLMTLAITFLLALAVWEVVNIAIERHLARLTRQAQIARMARLRTLLPILRATLLIAVLTVTGLMVLSEIGVNTAPLLASAGIIGVAIGFGSQKLVQDLITGLFLLLENTMQVGDVVSLGGLSGVVEDLSVRTIRLRSEDGSVHVIPFSSVTTVTNMTRDYSRAVIVAGVGYGENYDRVVEVLKEITAEMRADSAWRDIMLGDLEVWGLDQFSDSAVMIKCRIMCTPFGRWSVMREFNRRMKARFDEVGIEIPYPYRRLVIDPAFAIVPGPSSGGSAPGPHTPEQDRH